MGVSEKLHQMDGGAVSSEKWCGVELRSPLKPIFTKPMERSEGEEGNGCNPTTPTRAESRIPARLACPPPPKKRKAAAASRCNYGRVREFFSPPDLETIFIRRVEGA